jgi:hypothetical protein
VAAHLPVDGNGGVLARAGRRQHGDATQLLPVMEQGSSRVMLARPQWSGWHQTRTQRRGGSGAVRSDRSPRRGFGRGGLGPGRAVGAVF